MFKRIMTIALALVMALSVFVGCTGGSDKVEFVVYGSQSELATYTKMVNAFNQTYGKEHNIQVNLSTKPSGNYTQYIQYTASSKSGPDVFLIVEDNFKSYVNVGLIGEVTAEMEAVTDIKVDDIYETMTNRLRYNKENNTSSLSDPLYGLPIDTKPTALYYNQSMFEKAGIVCISVDAEDLDAWNAGTKADNTGKTKAQIIAEYKTAYPDKASLYDKLTTTEVPAKGYFREFTPYTPEGGAWQAPSSDEVLVFNNRIAMNWDEVEDLASLFSGSSNPDPEFANDAGEPPSVYGTDYGYFTEWWFNYGWSVGGDCLEDLTGNGNWNFSLLDPNPNYVVREGHTYTGAYTGKTYKAGETIEFIDKLNIPAGELLVPDASGGYTYNGAPVSTRSDILGIALTKAEQESVANGGTVDTTNKVLAELPSTREAFTRYLKLGAEKTANIDNEGGLNISPNPNRITSAKPLATWFFSQDLAMMVNYSIYMAEVAEYANSYGFKWDVAPLVVYKRYEDPSDPYCDTVIASGKPAGHSNSTAMVVRKRSEKKDKAAAFIMWMASETAQAIRTPDGYFPNQESLLDTVTFPGDIAPSNIKVFSEALGFQGAGDWWYMEDYEWINVWAVPLNSKVRNGTLDYTAWYSDVITKTNVKLKDY